MSTSSSHRPPSTPSLPDGVRIVTESPAGAFPAVVHPEWARGFPWLVQGTTTRGPDAHGGPFDLRLFPEAIGARERWQALLAWSELPSAVHARQVHEAGVRRHGAPADVGLKLVPECDGHVAADPELLLAVSVADCVPVSVVDPRRRTVAVIHAGWRGAAAGVLEEGVGALVEAGAEPAELRLHLGPSICGRCYEVGGEVFEALDLPRPSAPTPIDLRAVLAQRALATGVAAAAVTVSGHCTLCDPQRRFFSHRGGDEGRQVGFLGVRP